MKNFSAKNAEFETVTINNEAAITSADLGTDPNKIPLNKDLGSLAYQDAVNLDDVSADMLELRAIAAEISDSAVDVFVYDTSRDSDGGAWRKRTQHTSWYNETLNTATRGARREFPAVAVIVAEANKVTIYDGDDPDLSMWMVFNDVDQWSALGWILYSCRSISMLNGILCVCRGGDTGVAHTMSAIKFIEDCVLFYQKLVGTNKRNGNISQRNNASTQGMAAGVYINTEILVTKPANDVAMTILPNATIDENTGLPVPTIAVATDGGVSVIKDDGTVVNSAATTIIEGILFDKKNNLLYYRKDTTSAYFTSDYLSASFSYNFFRTFSTVPANFTDSSTKNKAISFGKDNEIIIGSNAEGFSRLTSGDGIVQIGHEQMAAYTTSTYNTGWMPGDIKLATLSDTKVEKVGVDESTELITNITDRDFSGPLVEWSGDITPIGGEGVISDPSSVSAVLNLSGLTAGKKYTMSFEIISIESGTPRMFMDNTVEGKGALNYTTGSHYKTFTALGETATATFYVLNVGGGTYNVDNFSLKQTGELITNGTFDNETEGWTDASSNWSTASGQASSSGNGSLTQAITTIVGETYTISIDAVTIVSPYVRVVVGGAVPVQLDVGYTGTKAGTFTATSTSTTIQINPYASGQTIDNISVRLAEEDRSVNDNGLQIFGEIDKSPVAPGADLVAYSGFSANNYLVQPYNADLDFGTGDFCVMGWFNANSSGAIIYSRRPQSSNINALEIGINTDATLYVYTIEDNRVNSSGTPITGKPITLNVWNNFCAVRSGETINLYVNGVLHSSITSTIRDLTNASAELCLGIYGDQSTLAFDGEISLIRASTTAPTAAQIAKIYRDEKALFQDGAQATLYGTSDSVTALAYDDSEQLLHVGTASGRSDFRGLARVNNTTTAISNSISAAEGTIIQN